MLGLIKKMFVTLLTSVNHTKCISLGNQKFMIQLSLLNLHSNEYSQKLLIIRLRLI